MLKANALFVSLLVVLTTLSLFSEPLFANKFTTIGGGVSGDRGEKIAVLKTVSVIAGNFFILLGILALLTRNRFEGFIAVYSGSKKDAVIRVPIILIILGSVLVLLYYL